MNMKKTFLFLAMSLLIFGCEKTPDLPEYKINEKLSFGVPEALMITNESRAFVVVFDNTITDPTVRWIADGGTITEDPARNHVGLYKAPETAGVYKVCAILASDTIQRACVEITVSDTPIDDEEIFYNGNVGGVSNNPTNPTTFTIDRERLITYIKNYHYLNGGVLPGTIALKHSDGTIYGPWQTWGEVGQGGVSNAYWIFHPLVRIKAGTYTVIDSHPETWSHNSWSNYQGFTWLRAMKD